jgi:hypothetical protein
MSKLCPMLPKLCPRSTEAARLFRPRREGQREEIRYRMKFLLRIRQISFGRFPVRNFDVAAEGVRDDSVSLLGRVLIPHRGD